MSYESKETIRARSNIVRVDPMHIHVEKLDDKSCKLVCIPAHDHYVEAIMYIPDEYEGLKVKEVIIKPNPDDWKYPSFRIRDLKLDCSNAKVEIWGKKNLSSLKLHGVSGFGKNNSITLKENIIVTFNLTSNKNSFTLHGNIGGYINQQYREETVKYPYKITRINSDQTIDIDVSSHSNGDLFIYNELNLPDKISGMKVKNISVDRRVDQIARNDIIKITGSNQTISFNGKLYQIENHGKENTISFNSASFEKYTPSPDKEVIRMDNSKAVRFTSSTNDVVQIHNSKISYPHFEGTVLRVTNSTLGETMVSGKKSLVVFEKSKLKKLALWNSKKTVSLTNKKTNTVIATGTNIRNLELEDSFQILSDKKISRSALNTGLRLYGIPDDYHTSLSLNKNSTHPYRYFATETKNN